MTQRYLTHLCTVFFVHAILIFGGFKLFQTEFVQNHIAETAVQIRLAGEAIQSSVQTFVEPKKKIAPPRHFMPKAEVPVPVTALPQSSTEEARFVEGRAGSYGSVDGIPTRDLKALYKAELRAKIDQNKNYPSLSRRLGQQGEVVVTFTLLADGTIKNINIDSASRFEALNKSAIEAVKNVKRFRPIPKELGMEKMDVRIPIRYSLTR
jgi:TonB family protein